MYAIPYKGKIVTDGFLFDKTYGYPPPCGKIST